MPSLIRVGAIDPSLVATGMGKFDFDLRAGTLACADLKLIRTAPVKEKTVRPASDLLRRCREIALGLGAYFDDCAVVFAELPSGAGKSYDATLSFGMNYGHLAALSLKVELVEVQVREVKLALCGSAHADKPEIIEWAVKKYPDAPFARAKPPKPKKTKKGEPAPLIPLGRLLGVDINSHLADCCLIAEAGVKVPEFRRSIAMWKMAA